MPTTPFTTAITDLGDRIAGPFREPKQMLAAQVYDDHASIHDDETAKALGFSGGTIEGPTHFSQFSPLGAHLWGQAWFETGCISTHYRAPVFVGEQVQAFVHKPDPGATHARIGMAKADGTEVLVGTMSVGPADPALPTALDVRLATLEPLAQPVILHDVSVGMKSPRLHVIMAPDQNMGAYYPFSLAEKLKVITEPSDWYGEEATASPWGRAIIPLEMISVLFQYQAADVEFPVRGPAVGLFADQEIRLIKGPLLVGEPYDIEREVVFMSGSKRTESLWIKTTAFAPGSDEPLATMLLNAATFKDSYANYAQEHQQLYG